MVNRRKDLAGVTLGMVTPGGESKALRLITVRGGRSCRFRVFGCGESRRASPEQAMGLSLPGQP
jgi:hypothetical protein